MSGQRLAYESLAPEGVRRLGAVHAYVAGSGLDRTLIDLVYLRVSEINGCAFCIDTHSRDLLRTGVPIEKLARLVDWREAGERFTDRERAALAWAEVVTRIGETHAPDSEFFAAQAVFGDKGLVDLTIAIALINTYNRIAISFRRSPIAPPPGA